MQLQHQVFRTAIEIALAAVVPQGMTMDKMLDTLTCVTRGTGARSDYRPEDWARDFLSCLPEDPAAVRLMLLCYLPVYVCRCNALAFDQGRCDDCGTWRAPYVWYPGERQRLGGAAKAFWNKVQSRRLFALGMKLAERRG